LKLLIEEDYVPLSFSANASATGQVVFAGYGIVMPAGWNDFAEIDASGKWVLAMIGDPEPENPQSEFIAYSSDRMKAINARDHGAIGLLLVKGPSIEKRINSCRPTTTKQLPMPASRL
jgi:aminopeptidase YwaD